MSKAASKLGKYIGKTNKEKVAQAQRNREGWAPKDGKNLIRILPPRAGLEVPFAVANTHYNIGPDARSFTCLRVQSKPCPICDYVRKLPRDSEEGKQMFAKQAYLWAIFDLNDPDAGVQVAKFGKTISDAILSWLNDEDYGDILDPEEGRNIRIVRTMQGQYPKYRTELMDASEWPDELVAALEAAIEKGEDPIPDLQEKLRFATPQEMREALYGGDDDDDEEEDTYEEDEEEEIEETRPSPRKVAGLKSPSKAIVEDEDGEDDEEYAAYDEDEEDEEEVPVAHSQKTKSAVATIARVADGKSGRLARLRQVAEGR